MAASQPVVVGGTYDWVMNATVNSETAPAVYGPWDLTGAVVTLSFVPPSGVAQHFSAALLPTTGRAHYVNTAGMFNAVGQWGVSWKVVLGATVLESQIVNFQVYQSGAAL